MLPNTSPPPAPGHSSPATYLKGENLSPAPGNAPGIPRKNVDSLKNNLTSYTNNCENVEGWILTPLPGFIHCLLSQSFKGCRPEQYHKTLFSASHLVAQPKYLGSLALTTSCLTSDRQELVGSWLLTPCSWPLASGSWRVALVFWPLVPLPLTHCSSLLDPCSLFLLLTWPGSWL